MKKKIKKTKKRAAKKPALKPVGFIGAGNMAEALIHGILSKKLLPAKSVYAFEVNAERARFMKRKYKITLCKSLQELAEKSGTLLLCVKPQQMGEVLDVLAPHRKKQLFITIAAGIRLDFYGKFLGKDARIVRVMPNTPAMIGLGASAFVAGPAASVADRKTTRVLFEAVGRCEEIQSEDLLDAVTALSGSGPAFVYEFAAALMSGGQSAGLAPELAKALALQTVLGAASMLVQSGEDPKTLVSKVTSKGGTTLAGLEILEKKEFTNAVRDCILRAAERAKELSAQFGT